MDGSFVLHIQVCVQLLHQCETDYFHPFYNLTTVIFILNSHNLTLSSNKWL